MVSTITSKSGHEYEFMGVTNGKPCYHLIPQQTPVSPSVKRVITRRIKTSEA